MDKKISFDNDFEKVYEFNNYKFAGKKKYISS